MSPDFVAPMKLIVPGVTGVSLSLPWIYALHKSFMQEREVMC
jgi:hypothetical protein